MSSGSSVLRTNSHVQPRIVGVAQEAALTCRQRQQADIAAATETGQQVSELHMGGKLLRISWTVCCADALRLGQQLITSPP
jgi:hypothetical protein